MLRDRGRWLVLFATCLNLLAVAAPAQEPPAGGDGAAPSAAPAAAGGEEAPAATADEPAAVVSPRVVAVHRLLVEHEGAEETAEADGEAPAHPVGLGEILAVEVAGLDAFLAAAGGMGKVVLFLDGVPLSDLNPLGLRLDRGWLVFRLDRGEDDDRAWHLLLGTPTSLVREVSVTVGRDAEHPLPTEVEDFPLAVIYPWEMGIFAVLLLVATIGLVTAARRSDLLRDRTAEVPAGAARPFSLARCQMAWWSFLVVAAYVFIWLALDELDTITPSVLGLIGIGSGTALGARLIDQQKKQSQDEAEAALTQAQAKAAPAAEAAADPATSILQRAEMARLAQRTAELQGAVKGASRGFWRDVLWDGGGMSLHRFQIVVWTLVLGIIFAASVYTELTMPDFSATLLGLMGISSGTYLGFKLPERQQQP